MQFGLKGLRLGGIIPVYGEKKNKIPHICLHPYKRYHLEEYGIYQRYKKSTLTVHSFLSNDSPSRILRNFASITIIFKFRENRPNGPYNKEKLYSELFLLLCYVAICRWRTTLPFGLGMSPLSLRNLEASGILQFAL